MAKKDTEGVEWFEASSIQGKDLKVFVRKDHEGRLLRISVSDSLE